MKKLLLFSLLTLPYLKAQAQQVIAAQNFETAQPASPMTYKVTGAGGTAGAYSGMSPVAYYASNSPYYSEGSTSYGVCNTQRIIDFNPVSTLGYNNIKLNFNLAAFATTVSQGLEFNDYVTISVSTDGVTYYDQVKITGQNNAYWEYSASGVASNVYNTTGAPAVFNPGNTAGLHNIDGLGTVEITNLPQSANLYVQISMMNNNAAEIWIVDNIKLEGQQALPVEMSNFSIQSSAKKHILDWTTASENNVEAFMIERGKTEKQFEQISTIKATGAGEYSFTDENPFKGTSYYRIKTMDKDGSFSYSNIQSAFITNSKWQIYPTIAESHISLEKETSSDDSTVNIFDITGRNVLNQIVKGDETNIQLDLTQLSKGMYFVKYDDHTEKFMKM